MMPGDSFEDNQVVGSFDLSSKDAVWVMRDSGAWVVVLTVNDGVEWGVEPPYIHRLKDGYIMGIFLNEDAAHSMATKLAADLASMTKNRILYKLEMTEG